MLRATVKVQVWAKIDEYSDFAYNQASILFRAALFQAAQSGAAGVQLIIGNGFMHAIAK